MIEHDAPEMTKASTIGADITGEERTAPIPTERAKIIQLIAARAPETLDRFAELRSRSRTPAGTELIARVCTDIEQNEQKTGSRVRQRRDRSSAKFTEAVERLVGDLLRARSGTNTTGRIFRAVGKTSFRDAPVKYDMFMGVLDGLKAFGLVGHRRGQTRSRDAGFGFRATIPGRAARFWATAKLVKLAEEHGIHSGNVRDHFFPEPPTNPLVLSDWSWALQRKRTRHQIQAHA
jgi:hypothetical protein